MTQGSLSVDFIGIGAARSGTTWLTHCLRAHPKLCLSEPKEVRYFNRCPLPDELQRGELNPNHAKPLDWYLNHFRHSQPGQLNGEFSPVYLFDEEAPAAIHRTFPNAKLVVCLRNPIDRAYSHYWLDRGIVSIENISFEEALKRHAFYVDMGRYAQQLKRYFKFFPKEQVLILFSDDMKHHSEGEMEKVLRFLGVDPVIDPQVLRVSYGNAPMKVRFPWLRWFLREAGRKAVQWHMSPLVELMRRMKVQNIVRAANATPIDYPDMNPETRRQLRAVFQEEVRELEALVGRDLSCWE